MMAVPFLADWISSTLLSGNNNNMKEEYIRDFVPLILYLR